MSADSKMKSLMFLTNEDATHYPWTQEQLVTYAKRMAFRHEKHADEWRAVVRRLRVGERPKRKRPL